MALRRQYTVSFFLLLLQFVRKSFHDKTRKITLQMFQTYLCDHIVCHNVSLSVWMWRRIY